MIPTTGEFLKISQIYFKYLTEQLLFGSGCVACFAGVFRSGSIFSLLAMQLVYCCALPFSVFARKICFRCSAVWQYSHSVFLFTRHLFSV
jgi:hypothetical protein